MPRNLFAFLESESRDRRNILFLAALVKRQGGSVSITATELTDIEDGAGVFINRGDKPDELVLSFARKGAEAYFLAEGQPSTSPTPSRVRAVIPNRDLTQPSQPSPQSRHYVPSDLELAMMEEERNERQSERMSEVERQALREAGLLPWTNRPPQ